MNGDQHEHLAMGRTQGRESTSERGNLDPTLLFRSNPVVSLQIIIRDLGRDVLARDHAPKAIAQDGEQPRLQIGARCELMLRLQRVHDRVLHDVVGEMRVTTSQTARKRTQMGYQRRNILPEQIHGMLSGCLDKVD